jgi:hypothetical protein
MFGGLYHKEDDQEEEEGLMDDISNYEKVLYKLNVLASTQIVCNIMVCKCKVEPIENRILKSKIISKLIKS